MSKPAPNTVQGAGKVEQPTLLRCSLPFGSLDCKSINTKQIRLPINLYHKKGDNLINLIAIMSIKYISTELAYTQAT